MNKNPIGKPDPLANDAELLLEEVAVADTIGPRLDREQRDDAVLHLTF
jgi:hypothetical protein